MSRTRIAIALSVVAGLSIAGCGNAGGNDTSASKADTATDPAAVIQELGSASRASDGEKICDELFTSNLRISVQKASGRACAEEVEANVASPKTSYALTSLAVEGTTAQAAVVDQDKRPSALVLQQEDGSWKIARIGAAS